MGKSGRKLLKNTNKQKEINNLVLEANTLRFHVYKKEKEAISVMIDVLNNKTKNSNIYKYAFTEDELDFIINYDIKYRMGDELSE
jgi:hypothetical protein